MSRNRLYPTPVQETVLERHCSDARYVWNLAVEQQSLFRVAGRLTPPPGSAERYRQLTAARADNDWFAAGSVTVQQQALRDFDQAMSNFFNGSHRRPTWRRKGRSDGFRITAVKPDHVRRLNRRWAEVKIPKIGWVRFRLSSQMPTEFKSFRVTHDRAGRWHVSFPRIPAPILGIGTGEITGVDRGVVHAAACSDGSFYDFDASTLDRKIRRLQRRLAKAKRGSNRRNALRARLGRLSARRADKRKDFIEQTTTDIARRFDVIKLENLNIKNMTATAKGTVENPGRNVAAKAGLNRSILDKAWGLFATRLEHKASGRVVYVPAAYTSQRCSKCGFTGRENRESQAFFRCRACNHSSNADVNAAVNIRDTAVPCPTAGHAVAAREGFLIVDTPTNREPQHAPA